MYHYLSPEEQLGQDHIRPWAALHPACIAAPLAATGNRVFIKNVLGQETHSAT